MDMWYICMTQIKKLLPIVKFWDYYIFLFTISFTLGIDPVYSQVEGRVPGQSLGIKSDAELWRFMRQGNSGNVSMQKTKCQQ